MVPSRFRTALAITLTLAFLLLSPFDVLACSSGRSSGYSPRSSSSNSALSSGRTSTKCETCLRDSRGKITRDASAVSEFKRTNPKPPGCHQCEVDRIVPLSKSDGRPVPEAAAPERSLGTHTTWDGNEDTGYQNLAVNGTLRPHS